MKDKVEQDNLRKAGIIANNIMPKIIDLIRDEEGTKENFERVLYSKMPGVETSLAEFMYDPVFTSNSVKFGLRYNGYCIEAGRKFLGDYTEEYEILNYILDLIKPQTDSKYIVEEVEAYCNSLGYKHDVFIYTLGLLEKENDFAEEFILEKGTSFVISIDDCFTNTFILEDKPIFVTKRDFKEDYLPERMRFRNKDMAYERKLKLNDHQKELINKLIDDMLKYHTLNKTEKVETGAQSKVKITKYENDANIPRSNKIHLDQDNQYVMIPIGSFSVPIHISLIKNVAVSSVPEGSKLRINFKDSKDIREYLGYGMFDSFLKSVSILTNNSESVQMGINQMKRLYNKPELNVKQTGKLIEKKRYVWSDLQIKVDQKSGLKKVIADLELHENGFKYQDIYFLFSDIRKVFYQFSDFEKLALVHFNLKEPISVNGKVTYNLQFHRKPHNFYHDTTKRENEHLEFLKEQEEEDRLFRLNKEISNFVEKLESETSLKPQLLENSFTGSHHKENVSIYITNDCLVSLDEHPFFVLYLNEVEIINFERISFSTKTFDCIFVMKDKTKPVKIVSSIDLSHHNHLKLVFDSMNLVFMETVVSINWKALLGSIMEDPIGFYENGGWAELMVDNEDEENEEDISDEESSMSTSSEDELEDTTVESDDSDMSNESSSALSDSDYNSSSADNFSSSVDNARHSKHFKM
ncbi:SPT16 [Hepatospora eriocheir]|uniref:FACT complex subunit n=1 Tax=Hepatospora eriocheir TaxID=1081669 RepID=A0A1X0QHT4_9MICR|nr:SPT16 [Hepatospora eriocheir]